jgi:hypothetical protein
LVLDVAANTVVLSCNDINGVRHQFSLSLPNKTLTMAPTKNDAPAVKTKTAYVPTGKPRGRRPGQKTKKTMMREKAAEMRRKGGIGKKE